MKNRSALLVVSVPITSNERPFPMTKRPLYQAIASCLKAIENCKTAGNTEWLDRHEERLARLVDLLPSGSGLDQGTKLLDSSTPEKLQFTAPFPHMNENGYYDSWTDHVVTIRPSLLSGFTVSVSGRDRNQIKDYIAETYHQALSEEVEP